LKWTCASKTPTIVATASAHSATETYRLVPFIATLPCEDKNPTAAFRQRTQPILETPRNQPTNGQPGKMGQAGSQVIDNLEKNSNCECDAHIELRERMDSL
jgi:hypothetical protein